MNDDKKGTDKGEKMKRKITGIFLGVLTSVVMLTGCSVGGKNIRITTGMGDNDLFKINGSKFSVPEAKMYLTTEKNIYETSFGTDIWDKKAGDVTFEEYVKNNLKDRFAQIKTLNLLAKNKKIRLTDDEKQSAARAAERYFKTLNVGDKAYLKVTEKEIVNAYEEYLLANKVYEELVKDVAPEISDVDAKVIKVASIYVKTYQMNDAGERVEYSQEEKDQAKNKINELLKQVQEGADFISLADEKTEGSETEYTFGKGEMLKEFEDAAFALKTDEISGVVETPDGYFIIKCISDYMKDETQKNKENMIQKAKDEAFLAVYEPFVNSVSSEFNDRAWEQIKFSEMDQVTVSNFYQCIEEVMQ